MTRHVFAVVSTLILEALAKSKTGTAPSEFLYLPLSYSNLGISLDTFHRVMVMLKAKGLVVSHDNIVEITDSGRAFTAMLQKDKMAIIKEGE